MDQAPQLHLGQPSEATAAGVVDASDRRWFVLGSRDEIRSIVGRGLSHGNGASKTAREIVNRLAAQGHTQFAELL